MLTRLTCDSLGELDEGRARAVINAALATIYRDLEDRGHDQESRKLEISVDFCAKQGLIVMDVQVKAKVPAYRCNLTSGKMLVASENKQPILCFQEGDGSNPDQSTLPFEGSDGEVPND